MSILSRTLSIGFMVLLVPLATRAADVDCANANTRAACGECGTGGPLICCPLNKPITSCEVINVPPATPLTFSPLHVTATEGGLTFQLVRTQTPTGFHIEVSAIFLPEVFNQGTTLVADVTGGKDPEIGALLYVLALKADEATMDEATAQGAALTQVNSLGYGINVAIASVKSCGDVYGTQASKICSELVDALSRSIAGQLEAAGPAEFPAFLAGGQALGFGVGCQVPPSTTP
jgi:hypothetical protein